MTSAEVGLLSLCITLLIALAGVIWKAATLLTELQKMIEGVKDSVLSIKAEIAESAAARAEIPLLKQRVGVLEEVVQHEVKGRLSTIWDRLYSSDKHRAVVAQRVKAIERRASQPDIDLTNDDDEE